MNLFFTYGGDEDLVECEVRAGDLEHVLLEDEVLAPLLLDVALELRAERAVVVQTRHAPVDLETRHVEELALQQVLALHAVVFLGQI